MSRIEFCLTPKRVDFPPSPKHDRVRNFMAVGSEAYLVQVGLFLFISDFLSENCRLDEIVDKGTISSGPQLRQTEVTIYLGVNAKPLPRIGPMRSHLNTTWERFNLSQQQT